MNGKERLSLRVKHLKKNFENKLLKQMVARFCSSGVLKGYKYEIATQ